MKRFQWPLVVAMLLCLLWAGAASAEVSLPSIFSDHMVVQRDMPIPIWGQAAPGEKVTVSLGARRVNTTADAQGKWMVRLPALRAGGPHVLKAAGANTVTVNDVLIGEVWLASGQSNMQMSVDSSQNAKQEEGEAEFPQLRMFTVARAPAMEPQSDCEGEWVVCRPQTVRGFSAAAYFFARDLHRRLGVPVGIIHSSWGGTRVQVWMSRDTLAADPAFAPTLEEADKGMQEFARDFLANKAPQVAAWTAKAEAAQAAGRPLPLPPQFPPDPRTPGQWPELPTVLYNGMIAPVVPYAIRGAIWYQGESNAWEAYRYRALFPAMIEGWRKAWGEGDFPFVFVQLANFGQAPGPEGPGDSAWAELREAQAMTLSLPNTGMAVTIDIGEGDDIHPKNKQEVGRRLALAAGNLVYGWKDEYSGPMYASLIIKGNAAHVGFTHTGGGLAAAGSEKPQGFAIAGTDGRFFWADAVIEGDTVVLTNEKVPQPVAVRYAWGDDPPNSFYNAAGLPAAPFRTDDWPGATAGK
jgi:sialate O-acetylesterase